MLMKQQYLKPIAEWEVMRMTGLLCDSSLDGGLDPVIDEPLY